MIPLFSPSVFPLSSLIWKPPRFLKSFICLSVLSFWSLITDLDVCFTVSTFTSYFSGVTPQGARDYPEHLSEKAIYMSLCLHLFYFRTCFIIPLNSPCLVDIEWTIPVNIYCVLVRNPSVRLKILQMTVGYRMKTTPKFPSTAPLPLLFLSHSSLTCSGFFSLTSTDLTSLLFLLISLSFLSLLLSFSWLPLH